MDLTPMTHHKVRNALAWANIKGVTYKTSPGKPDQLVLLLDEGKDFERVVIIEGEPLNLRFGDRSDLPSAPPKKD